MIQLLWLTITSWERVSRINFVLPPFIILEDTTTIALKFTKNYCWKIKTVTLSTSILLFVTIGKITMTFLKTICRFISIISRKVFLPKTWKPAIPFKFQVVKRQNKICKNWRKNMKEVICMKTMTYWDTIKVYLETGKTLWKFSLLWLKFTQSPNWI